MVFLIIRCDLQKQRMTEASKVMFSGSNGEKVIEKNIVIIQASLLNLQLFPYHADCLCLFIHLRQFQDVLEAPADADPEGRARKAVFKRFLYKHAAQIFFQQNQQLILIQNSGARFQ